MPRGRAEDYKANHTEEGETSDQKQSKYPGADQKEDWQTDDFRQDFRSELKLVNEDAANAYDHRDNILEYNTEDRKTFLEAYIEAFNNVERFDENSRWEDAKAATKEVFDPMYTEASAQEAREAFILDPETMKALSSGNVEKVRYLQTGVDDEGKPIILEGSLTLEFTSEEKADLYIEATNGAAHRLTEADLHRREHAFALELYQSQDTGQEETTRRLEAILLDCLNHPQRNPEEHTPTGTEGGETWVKSSLPDYENANSRTPFKAESTTRLRCIGRHTAKNPDFWL